MAEPAPPASRASRVRVARGCGGSEKKNDPKRRGKERKKGGEIPLVLLISIFLEGPIKFVYSVSFNQESRIEIRAQTLVTKVRNSHLFLKHAYRIYTQKTTRVEQRNTKPVFPLTNQVAPFENCLYLFAHSSLVELVHNRCWLVHL